MLCIKNCHCTTSQIRTSFRVIRSIAFRFWERWVVAGGAHQIYDRRRVELWAPIETLNDFHGRREPKQRDEGFAHTSAAPPRIGADVRRRRLGFARPAVRYLRRLFMVDSHLRGTPSRGLGSSTPPHRLRFMPIRCRVIRRSLRGYRHDVHCKEIYAVSTLGRRSDVMHNELPLHDFATENIITRAGTLRSPRGSTGRSRFVGRASSTSARDSCDSRLRRTALTANAASTAMRRCQRTNGRMLP